MAKMIQKMLPDSKLLTFCLLCVVGIVLTMPFHAFISTWGGTAIGPLLVWKSWKEVILFVVSLVIVVWFLRQKIDLRRFLSDKLVIVIIAYGLLTVLTALLRYENNGLEATIAGTASNLRFPAILLIGYVIFRFSNPCYDRWRSYALRYLVVIGAVLTMVGLLQVTLLPQDFLSSFGYQKDVTIAPYILIDENPDARRAFATLRGPNDYGAFLVVSLIATMIIALRHRWVWLLTAFVAGGIFLSGSRSAWLGAAVAVGVFAVIATGTRVLRSKKLITGMVAGFVVGLAGLYLALEIPQVRLAIFHSSPGDSSLTEGSTNAHIRAIGDGITRVIKNPLGCGPGCAGPASYYGNSPQISENYYIQIAEEVGVIGLGLFVAMVGIIARRLYLSRDDKLGLLLFASGSGLIAIGFLLHVWSDDPLSLTFFALVGVVLGNIERLNTGKKSTIKVL